MNPNEVQPVQSEYGAPNPDPRLTKRKIILIFSAVIGVILLFFVLDYFQILSWSKYFFKPKSISRQVPVTKTVAKGVLTAISGTDVTVTVYGKPQTFSIAKTRDFQQVVSGNTEAGDAKVVLTTMSVLKVGQEVLIIADKDSAEAKTVYILR